MIAGRMYEVCPVLEKGCFLVMQRVMLSGKIHTATITRCLVDYEGSLEIDPELLKEPLDYEFTERKTRNYKE